MRKMHFIFISFVIPSISVFGQTYFPFPDSTANWNVSWSDASCFTSGLPDGNYSYFLGGDTTINANLYHSLYRVGLCAGCCFPPVSPVNGYVGAYRNDSANKIVLWVAANSSNEDTLYNFNLVVGDTLKGRLASACTDARVIIVDSILIDNVFHKRFHFSGTICEGDLIEGVGNTLGLIEPLKTFEGGGILNCMRRNNHNIYPDSVSDCNLITAIRTMPDLTSLINIEVDNFNRQLIIRFDSRFHRGKNFNVLISDINGRIIYSSSDFENEIYFSFEVQRVLFVRIFNGNDFLIRKIF